MNIELTAEDQSTVDHLLRSGRFQTAEEVIHIGLQQLHEEEQNNARIRRLVQEGVTSAETESLITGEQLPQDLEARRRTRA